MPILHTRFSTDRVYRGYYLEAITIVSACNKLLRKQFLKQNNTGFIPSVCYSRNVRYGKKS